jgi:alpha-mannosidase
MPVEPQGDRDYSYMDQGIQEFRYVLLPHTGSWEQAGTMRRAAELNQPPIVQTTTFHPQGSLPLSASFLAAEPENIAVSAFKPAEDGAGLVLRAWETARTATPATIQIPVCGRTIQADFRPGEIKTFRIPRDSASPVVETNFLELE